MKNLYTFMISLVLLGCAKENVDSFVVNTALELSITDASGNDLLNPQAAHAIDQSQIKLFYQVNGQMKEVYDARMDYPRNFFIYKHANNYRMRIFLNDATTEEAQTYIQWNATDTDTLKASFIKSSAMVSVQKVWLNEKPIWTAADKSELYWALKK